MCNIAVFGHGVGFVCITVAVGTKKTMVPAHKVSADKNVRANTKPRITFRSHSVVVVVVVVNVFRLAPLVVV